MKKLRYISVWDREVRINHIILITLEHRCCCLSPVALNIKKHKMNLSYHYRSILDISFEIGSHKFFVCVCACVCACLWVCECECVFCVMRLCPVSQLG